MLFERKVITRNIFLVSFISLFTDIASEMLYPVMPAFLRSIGFSFLLIGILEGIAESVAGISKGYFGNLSDKIRKRLPFIQAGYTLSAISKPLMAISVFPLWIFFARTIDRIGKGLRTGARDALLSDETEPGNKGKVFGFHRSMDTIGAAIGPVIALVFLYYYPGNYRAIFLIAFLPGIFAIFFTFLIREKKTEKKTGTKISFFSFIKYWKVASPDYKKVVIGLLAFTLFNSSDVFLLLVLKNDGMSDLKMIGFYIFYNIIYALLSFPIGIIADKIGLKRILLFGLSMFVIVYSFISFVCNIYIFIFLFFIYGIYAASTEGISKALISNLCRKEDVATSIGFYTGFASILSFLASTVFGLIWSLSHNPGPAFLVSAAGVTVVIFYMAITLRHRSEELRS
jgi:MFS family permease